MFIGIGVPLTGVSSALNAALGLDFLTGALDPRITFTRASSATYFDSTGRLATASNDAPRFDYDPATPAGTVGAELVTNGDFSNGTTRWAPNNGATLSIVNGALRVTNGGAFGGAFNSPAIGLTVGKRYRVEFNYLGGTSTSIAANTQSGQTIGPFTTAVGHKTADFVALSPNFFLFIDGVIGNYGDFDNISVKEVTFAPRGLLIEESRQNLLLHSRDMTQAAWTKTDVTPTRNQVGIDGTANSACLMTEGSAGTAAVVQGALSVTAGSTITASAVLKRGNTDWIRVVVGDTTGTDGASAWFNLATGVKGSVIARNAGTNNSSTITSLGGGWYRCTVTTLPNGTYTAAGVNLISSVTADLSGSRVANATYIVDAAQLEVGAFATSIIPTGAATATRAADIAVLPTAGWMNATEGTFVAEVASQSPNNSNGVVSNVSAPNRDVLFGGFTIARSADNVPTNINSNAFASVQPNAPVRMSTSYKTGVGRSVTGKGLVPVDGTYDGSYSAITSLWLGKNAASTACLNGWFRSLVYYPTKLAAATQQALTA